MEDIALPLGQSKQSTQSIQVDKKMPEEVTCVDGKTERKEDTTAEHGQNDSAGSSPVQMMVSPVCTKGEEKYAFVSFSAEDKLVEIRIPECKVVIREGFSQEETEQLVDYCRRELTALKKMAAGIDVIGALLK